MKPQQSTVEAVNAAFPLHSRETVEQILQEEGNRADAAAERLLLLQPPRNRTSERGQRSTAAIQTVKLCRRSR